MNPDDKDIVPSGGTVPSNPASSQPQTTNPSQQEAAANVVRSQIESLYSSPANSSPQVTEQASPYDRSHTVNPKPDMKQWEQYHSAWQDYYQKYYEGYYAHHLSKRQAPNSNAGPNNYFSNSQVAKTEEEEQLTKDEALFDLRHRLLENVKDSATKVRKSRHFIPITAAVIVMFLFLFMQYNRLIVSNVLAYVSPGSIDPQNIVIDPSDNVKVSSAPRLIIPKINVDVPVIYGVGSDYDSQMTAMQKGVAQFSIPGASSHPGQVGNTVLSGHSSNDLFDKGDYKFIFAQLDKLLKSDSIYVNYKSIRYAYVVTKKEVVKPTDVNKLIYKTKVPVLTLITCTPLGTSLNRLLVTAEQVSPDPAKSTAAPTTSANSTTESIPGIPPTFLEKLFGAR